MDLRDQARWIGAAPTWLRQYQIYGWVVDPVSNQVICDTGQLAAGYYDIFANVSANVALVSDALSLESRNAANTAVIHYVQIMSGGANTFRFQFFGIKMELNERWRVRAGTNITGHVSGSIFAVRRG